MESDLYDVEVKDVIGPFPFDDSGMIMLAANGKMFPIRCGFLDGQIMTVKPTQDGLPYNFMHDVLVAAGVRLSYAKLCTADRDIYCQLFFNMPDTQKPTKMPVQCAALAVQAARAAGAPIKISRHLLSELVDATTPYGALKSYFKTLWPLPQMTDTGSLRALSVFMDEVMPNGSVFAR